jgi:hypothetical protein
VDVTVVTESGTSATSPADRFTYDASLSATAPAVSTVEGQAFDGPVATLHDADPNGQSSHFTATIVWGDGHYGPGTVTADGSGGFTVSGRHTHAEEGTYPFTVLIWDVQGSTVAATGAATVADASLAATGTSLTLPKSVPSTVTAASFTDADSLGASGDYTATIAWGDGTTSTGWVSANGTGGFDVSGTVTYTHGGVYTITVTVLDAGGSSATATSTATVTNHPPTAVDDSYTLLHDHTLTTVNSPFWLNTGVLGNDSDADGDPLTAILVSGVQHGALVFHADGSFTYTPAAGFVGTDTFTYKANDGVADSNVATVTLTVTNQAPLARGDLYYVAHDHTLTTTSSLPGWNNGVLANDSDYDGDALTATLVPTPLHGSLTLAADGSFTYTPTAGFVGTDVFKYRASDGLAYSRVATVTLVVTDQAPAAVDDFYATPDYGTVPVPAPGVLGNDRDTEGDPLSAVLVSGPAHGSLSFHADGSFSYVPVIGFSGSDSFSYEASDGTQISAPASVTIRTRSWGRTSSALPVTAR